MVLGHPSRGAGVNGENTASPIGPPGEPLEMSPGGRPAELQRAGISSVVRLQGAVVELRARVRGGQLRCLVDSGSTGNYIERIYSYKWPHMDRENRYVPGCLSEARWTVVSQRWDAILVGGDTQQDNPTTKLQNTANVIVFIPDNPVISNSF